MACLAKGLEFMTIKLLGVRYITLSIWFQCAINKKTMTELWSSHSKLEESANWLLIFLSWRTARSGMLTADLKMVLKRTGPNERFKVPTRKCHRYIVISLNQQSLFLNTNYIYVDSTFRHSQYQFTPLPPRDTAWWSWW